MSDDSDEEDYDDAVEIQDDYAGIHEEYLQSTLDKVKGSCNPFDLCNDGFFIRNSTDRLGACIVPDYYCLPDVFLALFEDLPGYRDHIHCSKCKNTNFTKWGFRKFRRVVSLDKNYYTLYRRLKCNDCGTLFSVFNKTTHSLLPTSIRNAFPIIPTHRGAIDRTLSDMMRCCFDSHMGPHPFRAMINELHCTRYYREMARYYDGIKRLKSENSIRLHGKGPPPQFPSRLDRKGYADFVPSSNYFRAVYEMDTLGKEEEFEKEIMKRSCQFGSVDFTFRVCVYCKMDIDKKLISRLDCQAYCEIEGWCICF